MYYTGGGGGGVGLRGPHYLSFPGICGRGVWGRGDTAVADMAVALPWTFACLVVFIWLGPIRCRKPQFLTHLKRHVPKRHVYRLPTMVLRACL